MISWKVLCTQARFEFKVEEQLCRLGIESYLPKIKLMRQWSDRKKIIVTPAFPGYIFVHTDDKTRNEVFHVKGVLQYVRIENHDAIVRDKEMELIHAVESRFSNTTFHTGEQVQIKQGIFQGYKGIVKQLQGKQKATLFLKDMALGCVVELPLDDLVRI